MLSDNHILSLRDREVEEAAFKEQVWHNSVSGVAKGNYIKLQQDEEIKRWKAANKVPHKWDDGVTQQVLIKEQLFGRQAVDKITKQKLDLDMHLKMRQ